MQSITLKQLAYTAGQPKVATTCIESIPDHPTLHPKSPKLVEVESRIGEVIEICETILKFKIPQTLVHGDFIRLNVGSFVGLNEEEVPAIFDWNNCFIGHPFFDLKWMATQFRE